MLYGELQDVRIDGSETPLRGFLFKVRNPAKQAVLRLPTSAEMIARADAQKSIRTSLGRRKSETNPVPNPAADLELFAKIRVDKGVEFDADEARTAIIKLTEAEVISCQEDGNDQYAMVLKTPFCETAHIVRSPTAKKLNEYRRSVVKSIELPHNQDELRYRTGAAVDLYDAVAVSNEGYFQGTEVPSHHKFAVVDGTSVPWK